MSTKQTKPKYRVPSMRGIEALPHNGFNVVSTFSGGGGSCLGYRMANYKVLYANEFIPEAQATYKANHPNSFLDTRDIREVTGADILKAIGKKPGEIDIFDGSPPCAAFSVAGKREELWGKEKKYSDTKQRVDDLFFEYTRILKELQPKVFVAENVKGLVLGSAKGYFKEILRELKGCGYNVKAAVLNAQYLGVPQSRERLIFMGVRNDLGLEPVYPKPLNYCYTVGDALADLEIDEKERQYLLEENKKFASGKVLTQMPKNPRKKIDGSKILGRASYFSLVRQSMYQPCSTICQTSGTIAAAGVRHPLEDRCFTVGELKRLTSIPDDFILTGEYEKQVERLGRMVPPVMMSHIAKTIETEILLKL